MAATVLEPQKKKTRLMTEGSIWKSILLFSVPLILGNLLQQLYNTADSIIVGNFVGSNALAAALPLFNITLKLSTLSKS